MVEGTKRRNGPKIKNVLNLEAIGAICRDIILRSASWLREKSIQLEPIGLVGERAIWLFRWSPYRFFLIPELTH
jgi:hypothetical protein